MPKKIGRFALGKTLGTGNFSKVRQAHDPDTGENVAIKIIDKDQLSRENLEEQLKREIAVLKVLRHPNVVMMKEVMQTSNFIYLVLELVQGGELYDHIQQAKRFSEEASRKYFQQLVMGVRYCHQQGIAHRDLKPENLLLDDEGNLKISDFGLSNLQKGGSKPNQGTMMQTLCGTAHYVAPEVLKEQGYNGIIADVWSCGIILFVMLAGYLPFDDPNLNALFNKIERGDFRVARHFSPEVTDLITNILQVSPEKRLTIDQIIEHPWFKEGFDTKLLENPHVQVSSEQVQNALTPAEETEDNASTFGGPDAFELIRWNLASNFHPITQEKSFFPATNFKDHRRTMLYKANQETAAAELNAVLKEMRTNPKNHRDSPFEVKGFFNAQGGLMTYVTVIEKTIVPEMCLLDVRRGRGKPEEFHAFVSSMCAKFPEGRVNCVDLEPIPY